MSELIEKVKQAKKVLVDSQAELLTWCRTGDAPVEERFKIWKELIDKKEHIWLGCKESKILNGFIEMYADRCN